MGPEFESLSCEGDLLLLFFKFQWEEMPSFGICYIRPRSQF